MAILEDKRPTKVSSREALAQERALPTNQAEPFYDSGITGQHPDCKGWVRVYAPDGTHTSHEDLRGTWDEVMGQIHRIVHGEA